MKKTLMLRFCFIVLCSLLWPTAFSQSKPYIPVSKDLYTTIMKKDSLLFSVANTGNIDQLKRFFTEDLEFFHDVGGLAGYKEPVDNFKRVAENYGYWCRTA